MASILVIEDDQNHLTLLVEVLKFGGHNPHPAPNTGIARKILSEEKIDFIITDITLPGMSGLDFMELLRNENCQKPFVVVTGSLSESDRLRAEDLKAMDFIRKPIDPEDLLKRFASHN